MPVLQYKTRANTSPKGKPRVFFSCHPEDFDLYFDTLSEEILKEQNCAIWYDADRSKDNDLSRLQIELSQMQLFVIPVTSKYLEGDCRAILSEYGFAIKRHIPLLPILMEPGLDIQFAVMLNSVGKGYGDIQYLDRSIKDATQISYEEKLRKRLSGILTDDRTAARVRAAFDAYIFLSYRKKDRAYAQELMRLIHRIPNCRDIAIWYDEFLVPGEEWSKAISDAMKKSKLFTLAITPNLTEPDNYIIKTEYPEARKEKKKILPAEMIKTDRDLLEKLFSDLPQIVDGHSAEEMEKALKEIAFAGNDKSPEHRFLIGLAYLGAIDVERDPEMAVELITSAGEDNLPEAMNKLFYMYSSGEGVERDYDKAFDWKNRYIAFLKKKYRMFTTLDQNIELMEELIELGDLYSSLGRFDESANPYNEVMKIAGKKDSAILHRSAPTYWSYESAVYGRLANQHMKKGDANAAKAYLLKGLALDEKVSKWIKRPDATINLINTYVQLGDAENRLGHKNEADRWYAKARKLGENLDQSEDSGNSKDALYLSLERQGNQALFEDEDIEKARELFTKAYKIGKSLADEELTIENRNTLLLCNYHLGLVEEEDENYKKAKDWFKKAADIGAQLIKETDVPEIYENLARCYGAIGDTELEQERYQEAKVWYLKQLSVSEDLVHRIETQDSRNTLWVCYRNLGESCKQLGEAETSGDYYHKALDALLPIAGSLSTPAARQNLGIAYMDAGNAEEELGNTDKALELYQKSSDVLESVLWKDGAQKAAVILPAVYLEIKDLFEKEGKAEAARKYAEKSILMSEAAYRKEPTEEKGISLARALISLGSDEIDVDISSARDHFVKSKELYEKYFGGSGSTEELSELANSYFLASFGSDRVGDLYEAKELRIREIKIRRKIITRASSEEDLDMFDRALKRTAELSMKIGNAAEAVSYYEEERKMLVNRVGRAGDPRIRERLMKCISGLGDAYKAIGNQKQAENCFRQVTKMSGEL